MKKILVVLLALVLAFSAVAALAEAKSEYNIGGSSTTPTILPCVWPCRMLLLRSARNWA